MPGRLLPEMPGRAMIGPLYSGAGPTAISPENASRPYVYPGRTSWAEHSGCDAHSIVPGRIELGSGPFAAGAPAPGPKPKIGQYHAKAGAAALPAKAVHMIINTRILPTFIIPSPIKPAAGELKILPAPKADFFPGRPLKNGTT